MNKPTADLGCDGAIARARHREHDQPDPRARHLRPPQRPHDAPRHGRGGGLRPDGGRVAAARDGVAQALAGRMDDHGAGAGAAGVDGNKSRELLGHSLPILDFQVL